MPSEGLVFAGHAAGPGKSIKKHPVLACVGWRGEHSALGDGGGWEVFLLLELFLMPEQRDIYQGYDLWVWLGRADHDIQVEEGQEPGRHGCIPDCPCMSTVTCPFMTERQFRPCSASNFSLSKRISKLDSSWKQDCLFFSGL